MRAMSSVFAFVAVALAAAAISDAGLACPGDGRCVCGGTLTVELECDIEGRKVLLSLLPSTYLMIRCDNAPSIDYDELPKLSANTVNVLKTVTFKDCPLPPSSFKDVLTRLGVKKTLSLIFQNSKNLSSFFDRKHFIGLQELTKLLLSVSGETQLPDNLFMDMHNLTWLNIRSNGIRLTEDLFKPLDKLETLEISHNHMTNISGNLFSHLSFLRKLSLWQSNVTSFSEDLFTGVGVLEELDLSSNGLNELPASIFNPLRELKKLTLFSNKFSSLPPNLFENNERLDTVIIFNNDVKLQRLPKRLFSKLLNLKEVYIQRCELEEVPRDVFANSQNITNISLAYNQIEVLHEAVFNDQINLLELDLSHNKITKLEPKLFSSLVRLEKLKLCNNLLREISGSTFSSLLSLMYLDMEHNNLRTITSYLFSNNKQRMSVNMAYNRLDFEDNDSINNSWIHRAISPFSHTYNLGLLNLSHNDFKITFDDWWLNGHANLDISYNNITFLWSPNMSLVPGSQLLWDLKGYYQKPLKQIWFSHNPLVWDSKTFMFLLQLRDQHTKGIEEDKLNCGFMRTTLCDHTNLWLTYLYLLPIMITHILFTVLCVLHRKRIYKFAKSILAYQSTNRQREEIMLSYAGEDEVFVLQELVPVLTRNKIHVRLTNCGTKNKQNIKKLNKGSSEDCVNLVVFTPDYITSAYSNIDIKQIRGKMLKNNKSTIYVFTDIGPENSIYAYLKEQRDRRSTIVWNEPNFWNRLVEMLRGHNTTASLKGSRMSSMRMFEKKKQNRVTFARLTDRPSLTALEPLAHSQV